MADSRGQEKEYSSTDPVGGVNSTNTSEPVATEPLQSVVSDSDSSSNVTEKKERPLADRTLTTTTTRSSITVGQPDPDPDPPAKKPWYSTLNPLKRRIPPPIPKERILSREHNAGLFSKLTWQWMAPLMHKGYQRPLELNDIWLVNPDRESALLAKRLGASFKRRATKPRPFSLYYGRCMRPSIMKFWIGGFCNLGASILQVISPFTLRFLISFANQAYVAQQRNQPPPQYGRGIGLVLAITFMQVFQSFGTNHFIYRGQMVGAQARGVLITLIFEKAMKLVRQSQGWSKAVDNDQQHKQEQELINAKESLLKRTIKKKLNPQGGPKVTPDKAQGNSRRWCRLGKWKIVNLMSVDTYRIDQASGMFHMIWTSPIAILITLVVLLINLSYSALAGFALLVIGIPVPYKGYQVTLC